jgi:hypothetical protein
MNNRASLGGVSFLPTLVYSSDSLPRDDTSSGITTFITGLQAAYSGSVLASDPSYQGLLATTGSNKLVSLGGNIITNYLGGSASVSS